MKRKNKKIIVNILMAVSIINIICLIFGYISALLGKHAFNVSLSPSTHGEIIPTVILLILQIVSIVLLISFKKKDFNTAKQKIKLFCILAIIIITLFVPVKGQNSIKYTHPTNSGNRNKIVNPLENMGATTHIYSYKNLYGITLEKKEKISPGIELY